MSFNADNSVFTVFFDLQGYKSYRTMIGEMTQFEKKKLNASSNYRNCSEMLLVLEKQDLKDTNRHSLRSVVVDGVSLGQSDDDGTDLLLDVTLLDQPLLEQDQQSRLGGFPNLDD